MSAHWWCWPTDDVGLLMMSAHWWCWPTDDVGLLMMSAYWWCQPTDDVGPLMMLAHWWCRPTDDVGLLMMSAYWWCQPWMMSAHWWCQPWMMSAHWWCDDVMMSAYWVKSSLILWNTDCRNNPISQFHCDIFCLYNISETTSLKCSQSGKSNIAHKEFPLNLWTCYWCLILPVCVKTSLKSAASLQLSSGAVLVITKTKTKMHFSKA